MAGLTLTASLPKLVADLTKCIQDSAYQAYMSTITSSSEADPSIQTRVKADAEIAARKYATTFATTLAPNLAQAIHAYTSEIGITIIPKGTLIAATTTGPAIVSGTVGTTTKDVLVL